MGVCNTLSGMAVMMKQLVGQRAFNSSYSIVKKYRIKQFSQREIPRRG